MMTSEETEVKKRFYSAKEIAKELGVEDTTVYGWMNNGTLPFSQFGGIKRVSEEDYDSFLKEGRQRAEESRKQKKAQSSND